MEILIGLLVGSLLLNIAQYVSSVRRSRQHRNAAVALATTGRTDVSAIRLAKEALQADLSRTQQERDAAQQQRTALLLDLGSWVNASRNVDWFTTNVPPQDRPLIMVKAQIGEEIRSIIQKHTGATMREETLEEATGGRKIDVSQLPGAAMTTYHTQADAAQEMMHIDPRITDIDAPIREGNTGGIRPLGGTPIGGYVGDIVDPDYNYEAKAQQTADQTEAYLAAQTKKREDDSDET